MRIEYRYDLISAFKVEGCVCKEFMSKAVTVFVDWSLLSKPWPEYGAVIGEEFAHLHLHGSCFNFVNSVEDFIELQHDEEWHRFERDARYFSAAVRMPAELLVAEAEAVYPRVVDEHGFDDCAKN